MELKKICIEALLESRKILTNLGEGGFSSISYKTDVDPVTLADTKISEGLISFFKRLNFPAVIFDEESGEIKINNNPKYVLVIDPIDGTDNYGRGKGVILPCSTIISIATYSEYIKIGDFQVAGLIDHVTGNIWYAEKGKGIYFNDEKTQVSNKKTLDPKTSVYIDLGPIPNIQEIKRVEKLKNLSWVRNVSSSGAHLSYVSCGAADAFVCFHQKPEELVAGYLMVKEGGGKVIEITQRKDIGEERFDFIKKYPIIASATEELALEIINQLE